MFCLFSKENFLFIRFQSIIFPLASYGMSSSSSLTNLSRSISLSSLDRSLNELPIEFIRMIIPRDRSYSMYVTSINSTDSPLVFNYYFVHINTTLPMSIHIDIHPFDRTISYLFICKFDGKPSMNDFDQWTIFCPSNLTDEDIYRVFLNNERTANHQSLIFALGELNSTEFCSANSSAFIDQVSRFTSNYELRLYQSACVYLDEDNQWKSNGLLVSIFTLTSKFRFDFVQGWIIDQC